MIRYTYVHEYSLAADFSSVLGSKASDHSWQK